MEDSKTSHEQAVETLSEVGKEWTKLGVHLGISHARLELIDQNNVSNTQGAISQMLNDWWKSGEDSNADKLKKLADALQKADRRDLREKFKSYFDESDIETYDPSSLIHEITEGYKLSSETRRKSSDTMPIEDIFIEPKLLYHVKKPSGILMYPVENYGKIFTSKKTSGIRPARIVLTGDIGIGKSALKQRMLVDWAQGKVRFRIIDLRYFKVF